MNKPATKPTPTSAAAPSPVELPPFCMLCWQNHSKKQQCKPSDLKRRLERAIAEAAEAEHVYRILTDSAGIPLEVVESSKAIAKHFVRSQN